MKRYSIKLIDINSNDLMNNYDDYINDINNNNPVIHNKEITDIPDDDREEYLGEEQDYENHYETDYYYEMSDDEWIEELRESYRSYDEYDDTTERYNFDDYEHNQDDYEPGDTLYEEY